MTSPSLEVWHQEREQVKVIKISQGPCLMSWKICFGHTGRMTDTHRLVVSHGLLQVLGHSVRVKTQEVQGYQLQGPEHHVGAPVY